MKNILLISYIFPPYPGIGGRRWAKFAKNLANLGYTVHVICSKNPFKNTSLYKNDILHENIKLYTFNSFYPFILLNSNPTKFIEKIKYKFWIKFLSLFVKGYIYDKVVFDKSKVLEMAKTLILNNNIKNIIVTGAPFRLNYYCLQLKKQHPQLNLIQDFRDPWTWGNQYSKLNVEQMAYENEMLRKVVNESDKILVPVEPMLNFLIEKFTTYTNKFEILPHAFDEDEISVKTQYNPNSFKCVFIGTLYSDIEKYVNNLCEIISNANGKITLDIYSYNKRYEEIIQKTNTNKFITYKNQLNGKFLFETIKNYDYVIFIYPFFVKDYISTKFYEIINCKIPIIYIGEEGVSSRYIESNNIGIHIRENDFVKKFKHIENGNLTNNYNREFSVDEFSFTKVTNQLIRYLK
jgi:hypothetical protein